MTFGTRLGMVRTAVNYEPEQLAEQAGLSLEQLLAYEADDAAPSDEVIQALAQVLGMDPLFFYLRTPIADVEPISERITQMDAYPLRILVAQTCLWMDRYLSMDARGGTDAIDIEELPQEFPYSGDRAPLAMQAADRLREVWQLGDEPVADVTEMLEFHHINVGLANLPTAFDAAAFITADMLALPIIMFDQKLNRMQQRFAVTRELGNLVLENPTPQTATYFAEAFLIPETALRGDLGDQRDGLNQKEMNILAEAYGVEPSHILARAVALKIISPQVRDQCLLAAGSIEEQQAEYPRRIFELADALVTNQVVSEARATDMLAMPWLR